MEDSFSTEDYERIEKLIPAQVIQLRAILAEKHKLVVPDHCDVFLARCLRMKDGDVEKAIKLVKAYHAATASLPTWDAKFLPGAFKADYEKEGMIPLRQRDPHGRVIFIARMGMWEYDRVGFDQGMMYVWMLLQFMTAASTEVQRHGIVTIWDFADFSMKQAMAVNKWRIPALAKITQNGVAGRLKELHATNLPKIVNIIYSGCIKPFLKDKIRRRVFLHDSEDSLFSKLDKSSLPTFLGGTAEREEYMDYDLLQEFYKQDKFFTDMMTDRFPSK